MSSLYLYTGRQRFFANWGCRYEDMEHALLIRGTAFGVLGRLVEGIRLSKPNGDVLDCLMYRVSGSRYVLVDS